MSECCGHNSLTVCVSIPFGDSVPYAVLHPVSSRRPLGADGRRAAGVRGISEAILRTNGRDTRWWAVVDKAHYTENVRT
jgi:hypothetical protein